MARSEFFPKPPKPEKPKEELDLLSVFLLGYLLGSSSCKSDKPQKGELRFAGIKFHGGGSDMPNAPIPIVLNSEQKVTVSLAPIDAAGAADDAVDVSWASADPSVSVEESADGRSATIGSPAESGSAQVTASAPGYNSALFDVSYSPPARGELNPSVGQPESDL